jgi:hypothetical protein
LQLGSTNEIINKINTIFFISYLSKSKRFPALISLTFEFS